MRCHFFFGFALEFFISLIRGFIIFGMITPDTIHHTPCTHYTHYGYVSVADTEKKKFFRLPPPPDGHQKENLDFKLK